MKNNVIKDIIGGLIVIAIMIVVVVCCISFMGPDNLESQVTEALDTAHKDTAVKTLSELRGRILEIEYLSSNDNIETSILQDELDDIIFSIESPSTYWINNPYLADFEFIIRDTSTVGEFCEELISQIDDQIHTIEQGVEDA